MRQTIKVKRYIHQCLHLLTKHKYVFWMNKNVDEKLDKLYMAIPYIHSTFTYIALCCVDRHHSVTKISNNYIEVDSQNMTTLKVTNDMNSAVQPNDHAHEA